MDISEEKLDELAERALMEHDIRAALAGDMEAWEELLVYFRTGGIADNSEMFVDIFMMLARGDGPGTEMYESICEDLKTYLVQVDEEKS